MNKVLLEHSHTILSLATFMLQEQNVVVGRDTVRDILDIQNLTYLLSGLYRKSLLIPGLDLKTLI